MVGAEMSVILAQFLPYIAAGGMALIAVMAAFIKGRSEGRKLERAKDADAYESHLKDLARAADARNSVPAGLPEHDPRRRD